MLRWLVGSLMSLVLLATPGALTAQEPKVALDQAGGKVAAEPPREEIVARKPMPRELRELLAQPTSCVAASIRERP